MTPIFDWCRHCGDHRQMTEEHLPPKVAGNNAPITMHNEQEGALTVLRSFEEGHTIPSLCEEHNNKASQRGLPQAYAVWHNDVIGHLRQAAAAFHQASGNSPNDLWSCGRPDGALVLPMEHGTALGSDHIVNLNPGKIVRQVLGMVLAVQGTRYLLDNHPQLAAAYHSDESASIEPFTLHVALADAGLAYLSDVLLSVSIDLAGSRGTESTPCWMVAFPPFLIFLTEGSRPPIAATRIDPWLGYPLKQTFSKQDRKVGYPIADKRELLVARLYQGRDELRAAVQPAEPS